MTRFVERFHLFPPERRMGTVITLLTDLGRCHRVTDDAYADGVAAHSGRYVALCGHRVAAALLCPPGPDRYGCTAVAGDPRGGRGRSSTRRPPGRRRGDAR